MLYAAIVGLGLGMVMQVLVLAVQNSVPFEVMGVATSGSTLFRQVGGSIGVSLFGAVFAARERTELTKRLPAGVHVPRTTSPERHPPPAARRPHGVHGRVLGCAAPGVPDGRRDQLRLVPAGVDDSRDAASHRLTGGRRGLRRARACRRPGRRRGAARAGGYARRGSRVISWL